MTIKSRLMTLIAASLVCLAFLSGINNVQTNKVYQQANYGNENTVPSIQALNRASTAFYQARVLLLSHILASHIPNDEPEKHKTEIETQIHSLIADTERALNEYATLVSNDADQSLLNAERVALNEYKNSIAPALSASREFRTEAAMEEVTKTFELPRKVIDSFDAHMKFKGELGRSESQAAAETKSSANLVTVIILLVAVVVIRCCDIGWKRAPLHDADTRISGYGDGGHCEHFGSPARAEIHIN